MSLADIDSITPAGYRALFALLAVLLVFVLFVVALHVHAIISLWREERQIRHIERDLGRR